MPEPAPSPFHVEEQSIAELQAALAAGRVTAARLVEAYTARIAALDRHGPALGAVQELNPDAPGIARTLDDERRRGVVRGPLHGIPVLLKDNIATADRMENTAGTLSLIGARVQEDAFVAARLRAAGAVILGKASMTEWANFKGAPGLSGWSARNGQGRNPYALDRTPRGSSSGSAIAVAASLVAVAVGTETDGSIVCPAAGNGVVGIKPTVGLTSRTRVIPISATQDTIGPFGRTVADAAALLGALAGVDPDDAATTATDGRAHTDYTRFLDANALRGARIGVPRDGYFGYSAKADAVIERALAVMRELGAQVVDPVAIPHFDRRVLDPVERTVMLYEFKAGVNAYLAGVSGAGVRTLTDVIEFNRRDPAANLPFTGQELLERADARGGLDEPEYREALEACARLGRGGLDAAFAEHRLDALVAPTTTPAWPIDVVNGDPARESAAKSAAIAGYPLVSVPAGMVQGLPVGLTFMGPAWSEPALIAFAFAFERATRARVAPASAG
jgi:amidase